MASSSVTLGSKLPPFALGMKTLQFPDRDSAIRTEYRCGH